MFVAQTAFAAGGTGHNSFRKIETYKVKLEALSDNVDPILDWRNPDYEIVFELPTSDWIENLALNVRFHAEGRVNANSPVHIQFNDDEPVPVYARGNSFEATIDLDTYHVKADRNKITLRFAKTDGCISPEDGAYAVDLKDSFLVVKTAIPSRTYSLRDAKRILNSPLTSPKIVAINAFGPNKLRYQALVAQGIALNLPVLPRYKLDSTGEAQIYVGTHRDLAHMLKGTAAESQSGPFIGIVGNSPLQLVLTANNQDELRDLVDAFATRELPPARRSYVIGGQFSWQTPMSIRNASVEGKVPLHKLGKLNFDRNWGNESQDLTFDIDNPIAAKGALDLTFGVSKLVSEDSTVSVALNDVSLGTVKLDSVKKRARFDIPSGVFVGTENRLTISPELSPKESLKSCSSHLRKSGFSVAARSRLTIKNDMTKLHGDLTRLAASGHPFSQNAGENSAIVFGANTKSDFAAALRAFAHLGKVYGSGWINSDFYTMANRPSASKTNTLFIGPRVDKQAPRELASVIDGRSNSPRVIQTAEHANPMVSLLSIRTGVTGGIMAIYPEDGQQMKGYITTSRGHNFSRAIDQILRTDHWNQLQGSVVRWNKSQVQMVKTAFDSPELSAQSTNQSDLTEQAADNTNSETWSPKGSMPEMSLPKFSLPAFNLPEFKRLQLDMSFAEKNFATAANQAVSLFDTGLHGVQTLSNKLFTPRVNTQSVSIPEIGTSQNAHNKSVHIPSPISPKPTAPVLTPRLVLPAQPVSQGANTVSSDNRQMIKTREQYSFGGSLRGLMDSKKPVAIKQSVTPQYQFNQQNIKSEGPTIFARTSQWISQKLDGLLGTPDTQGQERQANLLVFAIAVIFLLLLFGLARPTPRRP